MIKISESSETLAKVRKEKLTNLYAPVSVSDQINLAARYWAAEPRSKGDAWLCYLEAFGLDVGSEDSSYRALVAETWAEAQIVQAQEESIRRAQSACSSSYSVFVGLVPLEGFCAFISEWLKNLFTWRIL